MQYLITYRCESRGREVWGYDTTSDPAQWVVDASSDHGPDGETYILINALPVTDEWVLEHDGALAGM